MAIGRSVPMIDAEERVTGAVPYVLNLELPGMATGRILRSQRPHARLLKVDASRAARLAGVFAVLTRDDLVDQPAIEPYYGSVLRDQPVVAIDKVRFIGDPIAAVAAVDDDVAQEALDLIEVEYEELPAVFEPEAALAPGAPILHEQPPELGMGFADIILNPGEAPNQCNHFKLRKGDLEQGFREADLIFEQTYRCPPVQHVPFEPHVALAQLEPSGLTIWSSTQTPHAVRAQLAGIFKLPLSQVRVIVRTLGGGYGGKCYPKIEPITAALAWKARRPVKVTLPRREEFLTTSKHGVTIQMKTGVKRDGTLTARQSICHFNAGAYADISPRLIKNGGYGSAGPYRIPHVWVDSYAVYTNIVPAGAFRGYGISQGAWAYESEMDRIAEALGLDRLELRRKNVLRDGDTFATGERLEDLHFDALLDNAARAIGWTPAPGRPEPPPGPDRAPPTPAAGGQPASDASAGPADAAAQPGSGPAARRRGRAITCVIKGTVTPSTSSATVKLNEDGSLNVLTSSVEMGQGAKTVLAQIAADAADLPYEQVSVSEPDTDHTPYDQTTSSSRTTFSMGRAVTLAVQEVRRQLLELAAEQLEAALDDLELRAGQVLLKGAPERALTYAEVIRRSRRGNLLGNGTFATEGGLDPATGQGIASVHWHQAAAACEVEVDTETGRIQVLRFHGAVFAGRMVNPRQCELQTEGSTLFGLGQALFEEMRYDNGQLLNPNLSEYMIPSFRDLPDNLTVAILEVPDALELHGIGETSLPPVMPAIANAVYDAVGVRITDLPVTPEKVLRALRARDGFRVSGSAEDPAPVLAEPDTRNPKR